jgi:biopolymer transport protein ExbD
MQFATPTIGYRRHIVLPLLAAAMVPAVVLLALACTTINHAEELSRLPTALARPAAMRESPLISVRIDRSGVVTIAGNVVPPDALAAAWQRERAAVGLLGFAPSQATVVLRADPDVTADVVQRLIEQAGQAGFLRCVLRDAKDEAHEVRK